MKPGLSWLFTYNMVGLKGASSSMPLTSTMRGVPATTVPAKERLPMVVVTVIRTRLSKTGESSCLDSVTVTPRSRAAAGAETMLISARTGRITPARAAAVRGRVFSWATSPS